MSAPAVKLPEHMPGPIGYSYQELWMQATNAVATACRETPLSALEPTTWAAVGRIARELETILAEVAK